MSSRLRLWRKRSSASSYLQLARWGAIALVLIALIFIVFRTQRNLRMRPVEIIEDAEFAGLTCWRKWRAYARLGKSRPMTRGLEMVSIGPPTFSAEQRVAAEKAQMLRQLRA